MSTAKEIDAEAKTRSRINIETNTVEKPSPLGLSSAEDFDKIREKVTKLEQESLEPIVNYVEDKYDFEETQKIRTAFLRFISLSFVVNDAVLIAPEPVYKFWREFILHTEYYTKFCQKHFDKYLHHYPADGEKVSQPQKEKAVTDTQKWIRLLFPNYNKEIWEQYEQFLPP